MHETFKIPVPDQPWTLEGRWNSGTMGAGAVIAAPPHPLYGGNLDNPVLGALIDGLLAAGRSVLGFNWRGVGQSGSHPSGEFADAESDYAAALSELVRRDRGSLVAAGYSFGALAAISTALNNSQIDRLILVSPPASFLQKLPIEAFSGTIRLISGDRDEFSPPTLLSELGDRVPHLEVTMVPGADHFFSTGGLEEIRTFAKIHAADSI